jgi:hypothetical protein
MLLGWFLLGFNLQRKEDYKGETYFLHAQSHPEDAQGTSCPPPWSCKVLYYYVGGQVR